MSHFTPLNSSVVCRELPALHHAFDPSLVTDHFSRALFSGGSKRFTLGNCDLQQATYVPGRCCLLRYELAIHDRDTGRMLGALVTGRTGEPPCGNYAGVHIRPLVAAASGRPEIAPFANPVAVVPALQMAVQAYPIDTDLPALVEATDPRRMARTLAAIEAVAQRIPVPIETCRVELVDYGRQHRATLRYLLSDDDHPPLGRAVYGKLTAGASGEQAGRITSALRERVRQTGVPFHVPESLGWVPGLRLSLLAAIPGAASIGRALKARLLGRKEPEAQPPLEQMVEACASIAATVHSSGTELGPRRTIGDEVASLLRDVAEVRRISPELAARLDPWLRGATAFAAGPAPPCGPCHGDFTPEQVLFEGREAGLVDFDSFCQAEPALDLGQFLAYLYLAGLHASPSWPAGLWASLERRFLDCYVAEAGGRVDAGELPARIAAYRTVSLLRRAIRSWRKFKPERVESALQALGNCH